MYILQYVCVINDIVKAWAEAKYMCSGNFLYKSNRNHLANIAKNSSHRITKATISVQGETEVEQQVYSIMFIVCLFD